MHALDRLAMGAAAVALASALQAQSTIELGTFYNRLDHRDVTVSPLKYGGLTPGFVLGYSRHAGAIDYRAHVSLRQGRLSTTNGGHHTAELSVLEVSAERGIMARLRGGFAIAGLHSEIDHEYTNGNSEFFTTSVVTMSPAMSWRPPNLGETMVRGSAAALAFVGRPYSRAQAAVAGTPWRLVGPGRWRDASLDISTLLAGAGRFAWKLGYRLTARSFEDANGYAAVENNVSVTAVMKLGRVR